MGGGGLLASSYEGASSTAASGGVRHHRWLAAAVRVAALHGKRAPRPFLPLDCNRLARVDDLCIQGLFHLLVRFASLFPFSKLFCCQADDWSEHAVGQHDRHGGAARSQLKRKLPPVRRWRQRAVRFDGSFHSDPLTLTGTPKHFCNRTKANHFVLRCTAAATAAAVSVSISVSMCAFASAVECQWPLLCSSRSCSCGCA